MLSAIYLGPTSPSGSSDLPARTGRAVLQPALRRASLAYLVFQPTRFAMPPPSLGARWALDPPFHPYPIRRRGGLFSVALSVTPPSPAAPLPVRKRGALR